MNHILKIPKQYKTTVEKVNKFMPPQLIETPPMEIEKYRFTASSLILYVKPWRNTPYSYCLACSYETMKKRDYFAMFKFGVLPKAIFKRSGEEFVVDLIK